MTQEIGRKSQEGKTGDKRHEINDSTQTIRNKK